MSRHTLDPIFIGLGAVGMPVSLTGKSIGAGVPRIRS
jgi:hypothetical protein